MKDWRKIVSGFAVAVLLLGSVVNVQAEETQAEEAQTEETETEDESQGLTYKLGLDPSTVLSEDTVIDGFELYSDSTTTEHLSDSKKGIQGLEWMSADNASELGIEHVLLNFDMMLLLEDGDTTYTYNGEEYLFNSSKIASYIKNVKTLNEMGVTVTLVLLAADNTTLEEWSDLVYAPEHGHSYYGLSTETETAVNTWSAVFSYLAEQFGQTDCHVDNWILGNEVNMPASWNWTGTLTASTNVQVYADSYLLLYNALEAQNAANPDKPTARAYISLDRSWCDNGGNTGISAKNFLTRFANYIESAQAGTVWCLAFHPYAAVMDPTSSGYTEAEINLWGNNPLTPNNENAAFVTAANLSVLTDYVKENYGSEHRIILSEQGFDARGGEDYQAAGIAYTYYAGQFNDMVDAVIFRAWNDHAEEGLLLGIQGREAEGVFQYMDTALYASATEDVLKTIGVSAWSKLISGFSMTSLGFTDVSYDDWYAYYVLSMDSNGIMTGMSDTWFGAAVNIDRSQYATALYRFEGEPSQLYVSAFPDVPDGYFFSIPISWANAQSIIRGYDNTGLFGLNDSLTREQLVTIMFRYAQYKGTVE